MFTGGKARYYLLICDLPIQHTTTSFSGSVFSESPLFSLLIAAGLSK